MDSNFIFVLVIHTFSFTTHEPHVIDYMDIKMLFLRIINYFLKHILYHLQFIWIDK
jgi:hypothetical protein